MSKLNELAYFLNSIKETLPFKDEKDFIDKINKSKEFRVKVQKLVYMSKFFGWNNNYHFNFHEYGPYSSELSEDYHKITSLEELYEIHVMDIERFIELIKDKNNDYLESASTILYYKNKITLKNIEKENILKIIKSLKPHLSKNIISDAYEDIIKFNLFFIDINENKTNDIELYEKIVKDKAQGLIRVFETFEISTNRLFILGTLDYFRLVLNNAMSNNETKFQLLDQLYEYAETIEKEYFKNHPTSDELINMDMGILENKFELLQNYVSDELKIMPKLDEDTDLSIFF